MSIESQSLVDIFRHVAKRLSQLTDRDVTDLLSGEGTLDIRIKRSPPKKKQSTKAPAVRVDEAVKRLQTMRSREAGIAYLDEVHASKTWLEELSRALDLPVQRSDSVDKLRTRVIEGTIGYKLRSRAVHGREPEQLHLERATREPPEIGYPVQPTGSTSDDVT